MLMDTKEVMDSEYIKKPTDIGFLYIILIIHPLIHNIIQYHLL